MIERIRASVKSLNPAFTPPVIAAGGDEAAV